VSREEFLAWYEREGAFHLERPRFESQALAAPTAAEARSLFQRVDADGSGELRSRAAAPHPRLARRGR
jgi:hypothetical protein